MILDTHIYQLDSGHQFIQVTLILLMILLLIAIRYEKTLKFDRSEFEPKYYAGGKYAYAMK